MANVQSSLKIAQNRENHNERHKPEETDKWVASEYTRLSSTLKNLPSNQLLRFQKRIRDRQIDVLTIDW